MKTGLHTCPHCGTLKHEDNDCTTPSCKQLGVNRRDRLAYEWEANKHLLPSSELKEFICKAVMLAMEKWRGGEPPRPRVLSVELVTESDCHHEWEMMSGSTKKLKCSKCGWVQHVGKVEPYDGGYSGPVNPISPYSAF